MWKRLNTLIGAEQLDRGLNAEMGCHYRTPVLRKASSLFSVSSVAKGLLAVQLIDGRGGWLARLL